MGIKSQTSFSAGELDPILHDRVTLERFQSGADTARNVMISKSGTTISRFSTMHVIKAKYENAPIKIFCPEKSGMFLEFGYDPDDTTSTYCRVCYLDGNLIHEFNNTFGAGGAPNFIPEDLDGLHFVYSKDSVYVFGGKVNVSGQYLYNIFIVPLKPNSIGNWVLTNGSTFFLLPSTISANFFAWNATGSGYEVQYAWTAVYNGEEVPGKELSFGATVVKKPAAVADFVTLTINVGSDPTLLNNFNEIRIYSRPKDGSAYGYLGSTKNFFIDAGVIKVKYTDIGAEPDYSNGIPTLVTRDGLSNFPDMSGNRWRTGTVYQQRMMVGNATNVDEEAIAASRPAHQNNFYRDFPLSADSALLFKTGTTGKAKVLRMIESDGIVVFTTVGVYVNSGVLSPNNLAFVRRGKWIIDENIPALVIPGGLFFVDKTTSTIRQLIYSQEIGTYDAVDQSIFSDHLFRDRTITSWAYQEGTVPLVIVTFSDGKFATFTYNYEQQMKAWTRSDSEYPIEQVEGTGVADQSLFVINKNGTRSIATSIARYASSKVRSTNPEASISAFAAFMDDFKVFSQLLNLGMVDGEEIVATPVVTDDWEGELEFNSGTSNSFFSVSEGETLRFFDPIYKNRIDIIVTEVTDSNNIVGQPSEEFPEAFAEGCRLYRTFNIITGLDHLEGEQVSVVCDGDLVSSPNNDSEDDEHTSLTVIGGILQLPEDLFSAITVVGRPIVADYKTLNVSTVEQAPTIIESMTANKVYIRVNDSKGLYIANQFPENLEHEFDGSSLEGMQPIENYEIPDNIQFIGNRNKPYTSKRLEITLGGTWENQGQIALRQVDPFHFEILSIIADIEIKGRSDR